MGAPSYFPAIWSWVKVLLDPVTANKLRFLSPEEILPTLETIMDIEDIPQMYGGKLPYEPGMAPILDKQICDTLGLGDKGLPEGPVHWVNRPDGSKAAVAVGAVKGEKRRAEFATVS